jgi:nicotinamidase-related amidase
MPVEDLPIPDFYTPNHVTQWSYTPDQQKVFEQAIAWRKRHGIRSSGADQLRVHLVLIDLQKDFCYPQGTLYVGGRSGRGALQDSDRTVRFIYRNLARLTDISCTMDTHFPHQIFSPSFWLDANGNPPAPHREVTVADLQSGVLRPNPALADWLADGDQEWLQRQVEYYCAELERAGKYKLYLWPPHCLLGSSGHELVGVIHEARLFHAYARNARSWIEIKGSHPLTEFYSALAPEVTTRHDGGVLAESNTRFLETLLEYDAVVIAGQAASHCVKSTIEDLLTRIDPALTRKVYIMRDCMSSVAVPDSARPGQFIFDFTDQAEAALAVFKNAGMHVVESTTPMAEWPDFGSGG